MYGAKPHLCFRPYMLVLSIIVFMLLYLSHLPSIKWALASMLGFSNPSNQTCCSTNKLRLLLRSSQSGHHSVRSKLLIKKYLTFSE